MSHKGNKLMFLFIFSHFLSTIYHRTSFWYLQNTIMIGYCRFSRSSWILRPIYDFFRPIYEFSGDYMNFQAKIWIFQRIYEFFGNFKCVFIRFVPEIVDSSNVFYKICSLDAFIRCVLLDLFIRFIHQICVYQIRSSYLCSLCLCP